MRQSLNLQRRYSSRHKSPRRDLLDASRRETPPFGSAAIRIAVLCQDNSVCSRSDIVSNDHRQLDK
jgi:hypothetical protein